MLLLMGRLIEAVVVVGARRLERRQAIFQIIHNGLKEKINKSTKVANGKVVGMNQKIK